MRPALFAGRTGSNGRSGMAVVAGASILQTVNAPYATT
ncbi:hypothetical protein BJ998_006096 [Kutzneria kofuensis]|uniref:Uncharacterized protein n=1 Tax=Kutzneria kofuensis TaxID=103725 RepID=A0A7W9KLS1_9PSEU|nr:hypothetical protein [Kutzneria kofuensis]